MKGPERESEVTLHNILFATDFSPASEAGLSYAVAIADRYRSDLYIAHVINSEILGLIAEESGPTIMRQANEVARQRMDRLLQARHLQSDRCHAIIIEGNVAEVLIHASSTTAMG
jgi:nucleotide-binding universal stress UspA family protein